MKHNLGLESGAISLRPLEQTEIEVLRRLRNRNRMCFVFSDQITPESQQSWYAHYLKTPEDYLFSVYYEGRWVGVVSIYGLVDGTIEFGRLLIDRKEAGRSGLGVDATKAACKIAFEQLSVRKVYLEVYCDNPSAQITYLKAGFQPVSIYEDGNGRKMVRMELSSPEKASVPGF